MTEQDHNKAHEFIQTGRFSDLYDFLLSISAQNDPHYWYYRGYALRKLEKFDEAIKEIDRALSLKENFSPAQFELGLVYQAKGNYAEAAKHIKKVVDGFTAQTPFPEKIDTLNSLALTYKMARDTEKAFKYYNLAMEILVQEIYDYIKSQPIHDVGSGGVSDIKPTSKVWVDLALQIAIKNAAIEELKNARIATPETAAKLLAENPLMGRAFYDEGDIRYILPAYFEAFKNALRKNNWYAAITNNAGMLYAETGEIRRAGGTFMEAIDFIPQESSYNAPILNFEELKKEYGDREYWK